MKKKIAELLASKIEQLDVEKVEQLLEVPPKADMGDYAFPCFQLAKTFRKAPNLIAADLAEMIGEQDFLSKVEVKGAYLNFFVDKTLFVQQVVDKADVEDYGKGTLGEGKQICIDYSSPNVAKKFHVGHLRTTIIGNSLYKIFTKLGYKVERINHLGDWGTQFGKLIVAYKKWGSKEAVEANGIAELMNIYVKFHEEAEKDDSLNDEARAWFKKMEEGDKEALEKPIVTNTHEGQEFDYVLEGGLKYTIHGQIVYLNEGDSIMFDSSSPHGMVATTESGCKFLAIVVKK